MGQNIQERTSLWYSVQMRENTDQNNSEYGYFLLSGRFGISKKWFIRSKILDKSIIIALRKPLLSNWNLMVELLNPDF